MKLKARDALPWLMGGALIVLIVVAAVQDPAKPVSKAPPAAAPVVKPDPNRPLSREEITALVRSLKEGAISEHPQARQMVVDTLKKYKFTALEVLRAEVKGDLPESKKQILQSAIAALEE